MLRTTVLHCDICLPLSCIFNSSAFALHIDAEETAEVYRTLIHILYFLCLYSNVKFDGLTVGKAQVGTMCTYRGSGGINSVSGYTRCVRKDFSYKFIN